MNSLRLTHIHTLEVRTVPTTHDTIEELAETISHPGRHVGVLAGAAYLGPWIVTLHPAA